MATVARSFAEYGLGLKYNELPEDVVRQVKRVLLDALGCTIGGYSSEAASIVRTVLPELGGPPVSTVIGTGERTSSLNATLANGVMLRFLDFNDTYKAAGRVSSGGHPSEVIPAILAVGEWQHCKGTQLVEAIVAGYELSGRFNDGCTVNVPLENKGWNWDLRAGLVVPVAVGKLMSLSAEQIENAIGISGSLTTVLGILDASKESYSMTKNLRFPLPSYNSILAAMLARKGFTGPTRVVEGSRGIVEAVMRGEFDFVKCTDFSGFRILATSFKSTVGDFSTQGHVTAALNLVKRYNIKPEEVAQIRIWSTRRGAEHTGQPEKRYPTNKETADHSSYYLTAVAIADRAAGPAQFTQAKYEDPLIRELNEKVVSFEFAPELDGLYTAGIAEITVKDGEVYRERVDYHRGHWQNPMTDEELQEKFRSMASVHMGDAQMEEVIDAIYSVEKLKDMGDLMRLLVFRS